MAGGGKFIILPIFMLSFKLVLLGLLVFASMHFIHKGSDLKRNIGIAVGTMLVYAMSDFVLNRLRDILCDCESHRKLAFD